MADKTYEIRVTRYDPDSGEKERKFYTIPVIPGMTILEALWYIVDNIDGSLSFRYSCRGGVCGSCSMQVNREILLACQTQLAMLPEGKIIIEPLPRLTVIKDLVVDMKPFLDKYESIQPFFANKNSPEIENLQSADERKVIEDSVKCIMCGACYVVCPLVYKDADFLGPAALAAAQRFAFDTRNEQGKERLLEINGLGDFHGCLKVGKCSKVCPKGVDPEKRIEEIREYAEALASNK